MKKYLSLLMSVLLMVSAILPFHASAAANDVMTYEEHVKLAKDIFPEYAEKLDGNQALSRTTPQSDNEDVFPVVQKTRAVDKNTIMTYTEHNNGMITLGTARFIPDADYTITDSQAFNTYTQFTATIVASVLEGPTFTASGVRYRIYPSDFDRVLSAGSYGIPGYTSSDFTVSMNSIETSSQAAYINYAFTSLIGGTLSYSCDVVFRVRNNSATVEFNIR